MGTHGTSRTRAISIVSAHKFYETEAGHVGSGTYFWSYVDSLSYAVELAEAWWGLLDKQCKFKNDKEGSCAVVKVKIKQPEEKSYLDTTQSWFQEMLYAAIKTRSGNDLVVPEITALLIDELQKSTHSQYQVIKAKVATPPKLKKQPSNSAQLVSKTSDAYIVKSSGTHLIEEIQLVK